MTICRPSLSTLVAIAVALLIAVGAFSAWSAPSALAQTDSSTAATTATTTSTASSATTAATASESSAKEPKGAAAWFAPLLPRPHKYWHPPLVHFPIVFTLLEFLILAAFLRFGTGWLDTAARWSLYLAGLGTIPAVLAGVHDAGVDLGGANAFTDGLKDRLTNYFNSGDQLSVHVVWVSAFIIVLIIRLIWRTKLSTLTDRKQAIAFLCSSVVGCITVLAAAQAGGILSHP
ncbi:MAG TPA: DUF2231 domain-containing protein [Candidatus Obscuribacterales bacterium]